jgi:hypothetical protein
MILGAGVRVRTIVELAERTTEIDLVERQVWPSVDDDEETYEVSSESM